MATKKQFFVSLEGVDLTDEQLKKHRQGNSECSAFRTV